MGKGLVIFGANFLENAVETRGTWYLGCDSSLDEETKDGVYGWVYDGDARNILRGKTINKVIVNAKIGGTLDVYLVNYADATTHITGTKTLVGTLTVQTGYNVLDITKFSVGSLQSVGFQKSKDMQFYYGLVPGGAFSRLENLSNSIQYPDYTLNIGLGLVE